MHPTFELPNEKPLRLRHPCSLGLLPLENKLTEFLLSLPQQKMLYSLSVPHCPMLHVLLHPNKKQLYSLPVPPSPQLHVFPHILYGSGKPIIPLLEAAGGLDAALVLLTPKSFYSRSFDCPSCQSKLWSAVAQEGPKVKSVLSGSSRARCRAGRLGTARE